MKVSVESFSSYSTLPCCSCFVVFCVVLFVIVRGVAEMEVGISFYSFFNFLLAGML